MKKMEWKYISVEFSANGKQYDLTIVKRILKKDTIHLMERIGDDGIPSGRIIPIKISTSTFLEMADFWLDELRRYLRRKARKRRTYEQY